MHLHVIEHKMFLNLNLIQYAWLSKNFTFTFYSLFAELVFNKLGKYVRFTFTIFLFAESDKDTQEASSDHQQCDCTLL